MTKKPRGIRRAVLVALAFLGLTGPVAAMNSSVGTLSVEPMVTGLDTPWAFGFVPGEGVLITERDGRLLLASGSAVTPIAGVPEVRAVGQGGLLDVLVPRDFAKSRELFFTFAKPQGRQAGTAVFRGRLEKGARALSDVRTIFEMAPGSSGGIHFGSRLVEARDGTVFVTIGERGDRPSAQDLARENGSVVRITRDGRIPADNPFVELSDARPAIWSYGHRNPQGAGLDLNGALVVVEHGARGGDEINRIRRGANYGWPVIAYGRHYSGGRIGEGTQKEGMEQPDYYWDPSIAPSGLLVYSGKMWPEWRGDIFVGSLKFDYVARLSGEPLDEVEQLNSEDTLRVRDIREAPDGSIWFLSVGNGALYRMAR